MAVSRTQKGSILSTIETHLQEGKSIAFTSNQRITVDEITKMKRDLRKENVTFMLAKKTLIRLAFKNVYSVDLDLDTLPGQVAIAIAKNDPLAGLSIVNRYAKEWKKEEKISFVGAYLDGRILGAEETVKLASLPSREVLLAKLLGSMMSPLSGLARFFDGARKELELKGGKTLKDLIQDTPVKNEEKNEEQKPEKPAEKKEESVSEPGEEKPQEVEKKEEAPQAEEAPAPEAVETPAESPVSESDGTESDTKSE